VPLMLVTGRANAGKTGVIYAELGRALERGRRPVLLLPTRPDVVRARAEIGAGGLVGLEISRFDAYMESLWDLFGDGRRIVMHVERDALLRQVLAGPGVPERLGISGNPVGLVRVLARLIERRAEDGAAPPRRSRGRSDDVVEVVLSYEDRLRSRGLVEREEAFRLLAASPATGLADPLLVHRFSDLTASQERFVRSAGACGADVWLSLPWEPELPAAAAIAPLVSRLAASATVLSPPPGSYTSVPELERLERGIFAKPVPAPTEGAVDLVVAHGTDAEAMAIAGAVSEHIAAGIRPEEIAIAFRDPARHVRALRRALDRAGIAADYDVRLQAAGLPFGRAVLHLWAFVSRGMSRIDLVAFLRTPFSGADPEVVDAMDVCWRSERIDSGGPLLSALRSCPVALSRVRLAHSLVGKRVDAASVHGWRELADGMLASGYPGDAPILHSDAVSDARVHGLLLAAVSSLAGLEGAADSEDVVESVREALVAPVGVERSGRVQVTSVERLRSRRFEAVVLAGLTASEFPVRDGEDGSASEVLAGALSAFGLAPGAKPTAERERLLYYQAVTRARRRLTLVRQGSDDEGAAIAPSVFWDETLDLYRDPLDDSAPEGLPEEHRVTAEYPVEPGTPGVANAPTAAPQGVIADDGIRGSLARDVVSVSDIEVYLACPYRWFQSRVVAPGTLDVEIDARTKGTLAHDVLARFYRRLPEELGAERVTPAIVAEAVGLARRVAVEVLADAESPRTLDEDMTLSTIGSLAAGLVERDATFLPGWRPLHVEWGFGLQDEPHDFGAFRLRGRVDRIDDGPSGIVVVDYKTGSSSVTPQAKMLFSGHVQMPLYAAVAARRLGRPVAGGLYRSLSKRMDRGFILPDASDGAFTRTDVIAAEDIDKLIEGAVALAGEAVEGMRSGRIAPSPSPEVCRLCIAAGFCKAAMR
jgi:ATP-dependent helicase/nuclease subunit B